MFLTTGIFLLKLIHGKKSIYPGILNHIKIVLWIYFHICIECALLLQESSKEQQSFWLVVRHFACILMIYERIRLFTHKQSMSYQKNSLPLLLSFHMYFRQPNFQVLMRISWASFWYFQQLEIQQIWSEQDCKWTAQKMWIWKQSLE